MKKCSVCYLTKPAQDFQVRTESKDGRTAACRECLRIRDASRFQKEREKRNAWRRKYAKEHGYETVKAVNKRWLRSNALKRAAHIIAGNAMRDGLLLKGVCEICGSNRVHAHHDDYLQPLKVRWLCPKHHREIHK